MLDRKSKYPGRVRVDYVEQGDGYAIVDVTRADEAEVAGTKFSKATILPDYVAKDLGLDPESATPADALRVLSKHVQPEVTGITIMEIKNAFAMLFMKADGPPDAISTSFGDGLELIRITVNGQDIEVSWERSEEA